MNAKSDAELAKAAYIATKRAEWRLKQRIETLMWERDVLAPAVAEIEARGTQGLVLEASLAEIDNDPLQ